MRTISSILLTFLALIVFTTNVFAGLKLFEEKDLFEMGFEGYETINPNSLAYPLKRLTEKIYLIILPKGEKESNYEAKNYDKRFNELVYIINSQKTGFLAETVGRYNTTVGSLIASNNNISQEKVIMNMQILDNLRDKYEANSSYWLSIQQSIDTTRNLE